MRNIISRLFGRRSAPDPGALLTRYLLKTYPDEIERRLVSMEPFALDYYY
jgi:hypothetical protein